MVHSLQTVLSDGWRPGAELTSDHEAVLSDMFGDSDTVRVNLIFGSPLDLNALAEIIVDGQIFSPDS